MGGVSLHPRTEPDPPRTLGGLLRRLVAAGPDAVALIDRGPDGEALPLSRGELAARVASLTGELSGVAPGDTVAVWLPSWSDALVWQCAVAARGANVIGVNTRYGVAEVTHVLERARPSLVVLPAAFHGLDLLDRLRAAVSGYGGPAPEVAVVPGPGRGPVTDPTGYDVGSGAWSPAAAVPSAAPPGPAPGATGTVPEDPAALVVAFTTSGSTGMPKLAAHSADAVVGHAVAAAAAMGLRQGDTVLGALPLSGVFGYNAALAGLAAGAAVLLEPVFDAAAVLQAMAVHRVTHVGAGDDMMLRLAEAWTAERTALPEWRWLGIADFQGRSREIAEWARDAHGVRTTGLYGSSEAFALLAMWPDDVPEPQRWTGGGRLVGATTEVRAVDPDSRAELDPGAEGELEFRGPTVVDAYLGEPDRPTGDADGWFASGDLGVVTEPGVFTYTCRAGDALRLRGFLVDPAEIEVRLAEHPSVHTAKVVGVPGPDGAIRAVAFVVGEDGAEPDPDALRTWCAEALARFKVPHAVRVLDEMPTTSGTNGTKIRAATLREWAAAL
ncbi:MAG: AMP-binding protein [Actinomycetota bacterium]|nr:AMP-binding protein [Actinomycetota bacterium]